MANGLLGMFQNPQQSQMQALLGQYYDPRQAAKQQLWGMVRGLGQGLMNQGPSKTPINFGTTLGSAVQGGIEGSDQAVDDYQQKALLGYKMAGEKRDEDWQAKERARKESGWASDDANAAQLNALIGSIQDPQERLFAQLNPEAYVKSKLEPGKAPDMETLFDDATGQQYKAQWNPQSGSWERVGGLKADDNGITITNPDGTTTQIGGGKGGKVTEGMRRAKGFKAAMKSSIENLQTNFEALTDPRNYLGDVTKNFGGRRLMTPEGQMAADNFEEVVADALYIASGATLTAPEVERKKAAIIPTPNDDKKTIAAKKRRLDDLVRAVDVMAGDESTLPASASGQAAPAPSGIDPKIWEVMTPEERALWK